MKGFRKKLEDDLDHYKDQKEAKKDDVKMFATAKF